MATASPLSEQDIGAKNELSTPLTKKDLAVMLGTVQNSFITSIGELAANIETRFAIVEGQLKGMEDRLGYFESKIEGLPASRDTTDSFDPEHDWLLGSTSDESESEKASDTPSFESSEDISSKSRTKGSSDRQASTSGQRRSQLKNLHVMLKTSDGLNPSSSGRVVASKPVKAKKNDVISPASTRRKPKKSELRKEAIRTKETRKKRRGSLGIPAPSRKPKNERHSCGLSPRLVRMDSDDSSFLDVRE